MGSLKSKVKLNILTQSQYKQYTLLPLMLTPATVFCAFVPRGTFFFC